MAFVVGTGKSPVVYHPIGKPSDEMELRELNRMLRDIIVRLNGLITNSVAVGEGGSLAYEAFVGTGAKVDFDLTYKVRAGSQPMVTIQGTLQKPETSFEVQNLNTTQDRIHFLWTPQSGRIIMVWYEPV